MLTRVYNTITHCELLIEELLTLDWKMPTVKLADWVGCVTTGGTQRDVTRFIQILFHCM
jgi:hypothetical protein